MIGSWRFLSVALLLLASTIFLQFRPGYDDPVRRSFTSLPLRLGQWQGTDEPIAQDVLNTLGRGDFLHRSYQQAGSPLPVEIFMAYFSSQRESDTIHSPQNCLPGSGWTPLASDRILLSFNGHLPFPVNRYLIAKGGEKQIVVYWYMSQGRIEASEYWAKFYLVADSIRTHRSDGGLIRISTGLNEGESVEAAQSRLTDFAKGLISQIDAYIPR